MTPSYNGPERRQGDVAAEHRFTILEGIAEANKRGVEAVNARLSRYDHEHKAELRIVARELGDGIAAVLAKLERKEDDCRNHMERTSKLETNVTWLDRWVLGLSAIMTAVGGYFLSDRIKP